MKLIQIVVLFASIILARPCDAQEKHLFILSGQSNMAGLNVDESFRPLIEEEFGKENVVIVKDAKGGAPIRLWYRDWAPKEGAEPKADPYLYDRLWVKVEAATLNQDFESVTFIWMQGERDARMEHGDVYEKSLLGLYKQLSSDLNRKDLNFVNGRLSDFDMENKTYPHWTMIREIQVKVAGLNPRFDWVDTDDLNDGLNRNGKAIQNDLHMSKIGYIELGRRFAESAAKMVKSGAN